MSDNEATNIRVLVTIENAKTKCVIEYQLDPKTWCSHEEHPIELVDGALVRQDHLHKINLSGKVLSSRVRHEWGTVPSA